MDTIAGVKREISCKKTAQVRDLISSTHREKKKKEEVGELVISEKVWNNKML